MINKKYYHISTRELRPGTQLTVGTYGEKMKRPNFIEANYNQHIREFIFEEIRKQHYSDLPSRLDCVFLFDDLQMAKAAHSRYYRYQAEIYEVQIQEGATFVFEMDFLNCEGLDYEQLSRHAHAYWQQKKHPQSQTLEVILDGIAIVKNVVLQASDIWDL